jgi:hypothetical protein
VKPAYQHVESVDKHLLLTMGPQWAVREAFIAGAIHTKKLMAEE